MSSGSSSGGGRMRRLIVHADDLGVFDSSLDATIELFAAGTVSSASAIVPAPWFPAVAAWHAAHPDADIGLHLTLTSEWESPRWRPTIAAPPLQDADGYFHRRRRDVLAADPPLDAIHQELRNQIAVARAAGMRPSHLDSHMFVLREPRYVRLFGRVAEEAGIPARVARADVEGDWPFPLFESIHSLTLSDHERRADAVMAYVDSLPEGLHTLLVHPARDTAELREAAPDWRCRVADYEVFRDPALRAQIAGRGVELG
jgi:predicted glycoside hydrolase/deacetylase ChbG (UPF0249 family)